MNTVFNIGDIIYNRRWKSVAYIYGCFEDYQGHIQVKIKWLSKRNDTEIVIRPYANTLELLTTEAAIIQKVIK